MFEALVKEREKRGWSQPELARRAGLAKSTLWHIENGTRLPSVGSLERIARALDMPAWMLAFWLEEERKGNHHATTNDSANRR